MPVRRAGGGGSVTGVHSVDTPIGELSLTRDKAGLSGIGFTGAGGARSTDPLLLEAAEQLHAYFAGERERFDLSLSLNGTEFQRRVWAIVASIPYGTATTYGALADALGRPTAWRAVGAANGRNPLPIVIPCHRVVGVSGGLTGYGGGIERKRALLALEASARASLG
jgi:methylated-DNA-[protein]-cysteine S-methyltransferase